VFRLPRRRGGFWYGGVSVPSSLMSLQMVPVLEAVIKEERKRLEAARRESQAQRDIFAGRVGELQAEILRLNALGGRLVEMAGLDAEEFDFENSPPLGGPADTRATNTIDLSELLRGMTDLSDLINDRKPKLKQLERMIMERGLGKHASPLGDRFAPATSPPGSDIACIRSSKSATSTAASISPENGERPYLPLPTESSSSAVGNPGMAVS